MLRARWSGPFCLRRFVAQGLQSQPLSFLLPPPSSRFPPGSSSLLPPPASCLPLLRLCLRLPVPAFVISAASASVMRALPSALPRHPTSRCLFRDVSPRTSRSHPRDWFFARVFCYDPGGARNRENHHDMPPRFRALPRFLLQLLPSSQHGGGASDNADPTVYSSTRCERVRHPLALAS